ncbi:MAG: T9SS type A sorting domain-containing protein [Bacteroidales bacterium]|nr:T9SS type A sorting domain-containing protein [Bacteroidales bacterium]
MGQIIPSRTILDAERYEVRHYDHYAILTPRHQATASKTIVDSVNLTLVYECENQYTPLGVSVYNNEAGIIHRDYEKSKRVTQTIPVGTYDMFASYSSRYGEIYYVFRELVNIQADTTITLSQSEATLPFAIKTVDHTGKPLHMSVYNTSNQIVEQGTAEDYSSLSFFILKGFGNVATIIGGGYKYQGHKTDFYINKLSTRYKLCEARMISVGEIYWFNKYVIEDLSKGQVVTNDPTRFVRYDQKFAVSPKWQDQREYHVPGYYMAGVFNGDAIIGQRSYIPNMPSSDYTTKFYLDTPKDDDSSKDQFNVMVKPLMSDYMKVETYNGTKITDYYFISGQQVLGDKDGLKFIAAGYEEDGGFNTPEGEARSRFYPGHPVFSFTDDMAQGAVYGEACPINSVKCKTYLVGNQEEMEMSPNYIGRYGEIHGADQFVLEKSEEEVGDDAYAMTIINRNISVDGLAGMNKTRILIYEEKADHVPPTLQMLQFKNKQGNVTDRFKNPADGVIEIAGGDFAFNPVVENYAGYFTCTPVDVKVEYYPHGTSDAKKTLAVEQVPNYYFMPGFGYFYRGSLESVPNATSQKQWYDLVITITDPSGNEQTQTISPAFCITGLSGVEPISSQKTQVTIEKDRIITKNQGTALELYNVDGQQIAISDQGEIITRDLPSGVYVIKIINALGDQQTQKVIL